MSSLQIISTIDTTINPSLNDSSNLELKNEINKEEKDPDHDNILNDKKPTLRDLGKDLKNKCKGVSIHLLKNSNIRKIVAPVFLHAVAHLGPQSAVTLPMDVVLTLLSAGKSHLKNEKTTKEYAEKLSQQVSIESIITFDIETIETENPIIVNSSSSSYSSSSLCKLCHQREALAFLLPCQHNVVCLKCINAFVYNCSLASSDPSQIIVPCPTCKHPIVKIIKICSSTS